MRLETPSKIPTKHQRTNCADTFNFSQLCSLLESYDPVSNTAYMTHEYAVIYARKNGLNIPQIYAQEMHSTIGHFLNHCIQIRIAYLADLSIDYFDENIEPC